jgi:hypothetical protein
MITAAAEQRALFVFMDTTLPDIPRYRPFHKGIYTTTPSLIPLGSDFGNGVLDTIPLQLDKGTAALIANKHQIQAYRPLILMSDISEAVAAAGIQLLSDERDIAQTAVGDIYPAMTQLHESWRETTSTLESRFHALSLAIGEDIAIVEIDSEGNDRNAVMSIAAPSRWAPEEKIGRSFVATHTPVPNMEKTLAVAAKLQQMLLERGPFVRFTWGISTTPALDTHPSVTEPPYAGGDAWLRTERQVIRRIPEHNAFLFTIRVMVEPLSDIRNSVTDASALAAALRSMDEKSRIYKSVDGHVDALCAYLLESA